MHQVLQVTVYLLSLDVHLELGFAGRHLCVLLGVDKCPSIVSVWDPKNVRARSPVHMEHIQL